MTGKVSDKGQITLPASIRRELGIAPRSRVEMEVRGGEVVIRPVKTISELKGIFAKYAQGVSADWETVRQETERAIAREVAGE